MAKEAFVRREHDIKASINDEMRLCEAIDAKYTDMKQERLPWDYLWREIYDYCLPEREFLLNWYEQTSWGADGAKGHIKRIGNRIYDMTAPNALHLLTAGIQGYMVSQQDRWFRLTYPDRRMLDMKGGREWLFEVENALYLSFARSNFYTQLPSLILDAATGGTASQRMTYDDKGMRTVFTTMHPIEVFIAENHFGEVDTVYRVFKMTRRQAIQQFGTENLSDEIKQNTSDSDQHLFLHCVFPRSDNDPEMGLNPRNLGSVLSIDAPFISVYKELARGSLNAGNQMTRGQGSYGDSRKMRNKVLHVGGFREFPYAVWRWERDTQGRYGSSPCRRLLPAIRQINDFGRFLTRSAQLHSDPPFNIPAEMQGKVRLTPRGFNYTMDPQHKIEPVDGAGGNYPVGVDREERMAAAIQEAFGTPYFMAMTRLSAEGQSKTATEVIEVQSEKAAVLGSAMGRMGIDYLEPVIDFQFQQEMKHNRLPPAPEWMRGRLQVGYTSPLAQAQKRLATIQGPLRLVQALAPIIAVAPTVVDGVDWDELARLMLEDGGMPPSVIRSREQIKELRDAAAAREAQRQTLENIEGASRAAHNLGIEVGQVQGGTDAVETEGVLPRAAAR